MNINLLSLYIKIKTFLNILFETMTLRSKPEYEKVSDDNEEGIVYFDNPIRKI
jgi:hypothetical protein